MLRKIVVSSICLTSMIVLLIAGPHFSVMAQDDTSKEQSADSKQSAEAESQEKANPAKTKRQWPLFRGDSKSTGVADTNLPDQLDVLWKFQIPDGAFESTPAIVDGIVYAADLDGMVFALDLKTGQKKWETKFEDGFVAPVAFHNDLIYVGDYNGKMHCLDKNGKKVWEFQTDAEINSSANFFDDNVLFGSQDARLYCLEAKSGKLVWKHEAADQIRCTPTIVGDRTMIAGCDAMLHVIGLKDGKPIHQVEIKSPTGSTPAAQGDVVYFGTEQGLFFAIDSKAGDVKWTFEDLYGVQLRGSAAIKDGVIVFGAFDRKVYALDAKTGDEKWSTLGKQSYEGSPVIAGDKVVIPTTNGFVMLLNLADGKIISQRELAEDVIASPAVAENRVVIATKIGSIICLGKKDK